MTRPARKKSEERRPRVVWLAGGRGEILALGPVFAELKRRAAAWIGGAPGAGSATHFLFDTGEQGMAMQQALDWIGIVPDETAPLCHPADEPAIRMQVLLDRVEAFARQRKSTHLIFTGCGATAVAGALAAHGRNAPALWLAPHDPAGQLNRLRLESGYARIIAACAPRVETWQWPNVPLLPEEAGDFLPDQTQNKPWLPEDEIAGISPWSPLAIVAVLRREWGIHGDTTGDVIRAAAKWATRRPDLQWLFMSNLNSRVEGPLQALRDRPLNLRSVPPLPYPLYRTLLGRSKLIVTDSGRMAAEAERLGVPVALLGDMEIGDSTMRCRFVVSKDLSNPSIDSVIDGLLNLSQIPNAMVPSTGGYHAAVEVVQIWLSRL